MNSKSPILSEPSKKLVMTGGSRGFAPMVGVMLMSLLETNRNPRWFGKIVVIHTGFSKRDIRVLESLGPVQVVRLRSSFLKFPRLFFSSSVSHFSPIVVGKLLALDYLREGWDSSVWLDADSLVVGSLSDLANFGPNDPPAKFLSGDNDAHHQFKLAPGGLAGGKALSTGVFALDKRFVDAGATYSDCLHIGEALAENLLMPEQAILQILVQRDKIAWSPLARHVYACRPEKASNETLIEHSYHHPKFWDGNWHARWTHAYEHWLKLGGSRVPKRRNWLVMTRKIISVALGFGLRTPRPYSLASMERMKNLGESRDGQEPQTHNYR